jgi:hypothetical protein
LKLGFGRPGGCALAHSGRSLDRHPVPRAVWDDQLRCWVSDAEVAETGYTAFTSKKGQQITARLIVRRSSAPSTARRARKAASAVAGSLPAQTRQIPFAFWASLGVG